MKIRFLRDIPALLWGDVAPDHGTIGFRGFTIMYAVIETGGKQYRVAPGETVRVDKLPGAVGAQVELGRVLALVNEGAITTGDALASAKVTGTITEQDRDQKVIVFKFKRKKQYRKTIGHRQYYTAVKVGEIQA
jgi:large subunit ribosomal protein L21